MHNKLATKKASISHPKGAPGVDLQLTVKDEAKNFRPLRKHVLDEFLWAIFFISVFLLSVLFLPRDSFMKIVPVCPWFSLTHTYCPLCGMGRGIYALMHGNLLGLYVYNKLLFVLLPVALYIYLAKITRAVFAVEIPVIKFRPILAYGLVFIVLLFWLLRNFYPFLAPAPNYPFI